MDGGVDSLHAGLKRGAALMLNGGPKREERPWPTRASRRTSCAPSSSASSAWKKKSRRSPTTSRRSTAEAKGNGFDTKVLRQIVRIRKQDHAERLEQEAILELYMAALGMQAAPREDEAA